MGQTQASIKAIKATADGVRATCVAGNGTVPSSYFVVGDGVVIGNKQ